MPSNATKIVISVVIPVYNRGEAVHPTIQSVLDQDLSPEEVEIIVVDDGSTDESFAVLQGAYGDDPRVRLFSIPNGGVARARNFGLEQARGEFIAYLDHDDLWLPSKLRLQREKMEADSPRVGVVYCRWRSVDESGEVGHISAIVSGEDQELPQGRLFARLLKHNFLVSMSVPLVRTALLRRVGGFDASMVPSDDWDVWLKLARECDFAAVDEVLAFYCLHADQQSKREEAMRGAEVRVRTTYLRRKPLVVLAHPKIAWVAFTSAYFFKTRLPFYEGARTAIGKGNWPAVRSNLQGALRKHPLVFLTPQWLYLVKRLITRNARPF